MKSQRRILELLIVMTSVAVAVFLLKPIGRSPQPTPTQASPTPNADPDFRARGVGCGMTEEQVIKVLGPSKGDRFNELQQRYVNFGDVDLMFKDDKVSVVCTTRLDFEPNKSIAVGQQRSEIQSLLGEPFAPGPEPGPHQAPEYEFYRGQDCLLEVTYKGDEATLLTLFPDNTH